QHCERSCCLGQRRGIYHPAERGWLGSGRQLHPGLPCAGTRQGGTTMPEQRQARKRQKPVEDLELNRETLPDRTELRAQAADLVEDRAEAVRSGTLSTFMHCPYIQGSLHQREQRP